MTMERERVENIGVLENKNCFAVLGSTKDAKGSKRLERGSGLV
jgi:hypothetical protein